MTKPQSNERVVHAVDSTELLAAANSHTGKAVTGAPHLQISLQRLHLRLEQLQHLWGDIGGRPDKDREAVWEAVK